MKKVCILLMTLFATVAAVAQQARTIPYLESFENGLGDWRAVEGNGDNYNWRVTDFSSIPPIFASLGYFAHDGNSVLYSESVYDSVPLHPSNWVVSPIIELPAAISDSVKFSWWVKEFAAGTSDRYEVRIAEVYDTVIDTLHFSDVLFDETVSNTTYQQRSVSLSAYAGRWVRLAFHHYASQGSSLQIDYVSIGNDSLPLVRIEGPLVVDAGDTTTYIAQILGGSSNGLSFAWVCDSADYIEDMFYDTTRIMWSHSGVFRLGVAFTNVYGGDTAWMNVTVSNCGPFDTLPFVENFDTLSASRTCWKMIDGDGNGTAWTMEDEWAESNSVTFFGLLPMSDNWLISPPITLDGSSSQLLWQVRPASTLRPEEHYTVYIGTGINPYDISSYTPIFNETLTADSNWQHRYLSLADYSNETIRVAFRHHLTDDQEALQIGSVTIEHAGAPIVNLHAPSRAIVGDSIRFRLDTFSVSPISNITWRVQMDSLGTYATTSTLDPFAFVWNDYTSEGYYWVYVDVTNDEGTATDSALVYLHICEVIDSLPYYHTFGVDEDCWRIGEGWDVNDFISIGGANVPAAVSFSHDEFGHNLHPYNRLATPYIHIPDSSYELRFAATEAFSPYYEYAYDQYSVIARADGDTDTLLHSAVGSNDLQRHRIYLGAYAGRNVQFEFLHKDSPAGYAIQLAGVEVAAVSQPQVSILAPARGLVGETVSIGSNVLTSETLSYQWSLPGATVDTLTAPSLNAQWDAVGTYTIVLTVNSPLFGLFSDTAQIVITECTGIDTLPYTEHFDVDLACWQSYDLDGDGYGWEMAVSNDPVDRIFGAAMAYGSQENGNALVSWSTRPMSNLLSFALSGNGTALAADNLLLSPAVSLPDSGDWYFSFQAASAATRFFESVDDMYDSLEVLLTTVSPAGQPNMSDFTVLLPMQAVTHNGYGEYTFDLGEYLGQTIYIALHHRSSGKLGLLIDEVKINVTEPDMYTVTVNSANPAMGTVEGGGQVADGASVTISAYGNPGYHFVRWNDGNTDSVRVVVVHADITYTAYFEANVGVADITETPVVIRPIEKCILVEGNVNEWPVKVFDVAGRLVSQQRTVDSRHPVAHSGVYLVQVGQQHVRKVFVR